jgi:arylsulfatase A-like enzyme
MLLHAHFMQPFEKLNSLEKLATADRYQMVVSWDDVLRQIFPSSANLIKLDTDKPMWNNFEVCSTIEQTEATLDKRADKTRPVLFYAQPKNVHQFANNNQPLPKADQWRDRPGFNNRIAHEVHQVDECLGGFFNFLKKRNMYESSIILVTSDHGDATGELGRESHSMWIYPEIMRVPFIVHLPANIRQKVVYDDSRISALTDITPSLYYLLGHRAIVHNPLFGRPLFAETREELESYKRDDLFMASDVRADYGILADNGRWLYVAYDAPSQSMLFDLANDPTAQHNLITTESKIKYDKRIIEHLQAIAAFYDYQPRAGSWLAAAK